MFPERGEGEGEQEERIEKGGKLERGRQDGRGGENGKEEVDKEEEEGKHRAGAVGGRRAGRGEERRRRPALTSGLPWPPPLPAPAVDVALLVPHGHRHHPDLAEVEVHVVLMVVGGDPAHPHAAGLLAGEDPHGVIVLQRQRGDRWSVGFPETLS